MIFAIVASIVSFSLKNNYINIICAGYGFLRIFEITIYQINVLLFDKLRSERKGQEYRIKSVTRMVIALLTNYVEIIFWYSTIVITITSLYTEINNSWFHFVVSSILCLSTFSMDSMLSNAGEILTLIKGIAVLEIITGIIMTVISLAKFIGELPGSKEIDNNINAKVELLILQVETKLERKLPEKYIDLISNLNEEEVNNLGKGIFTISSIDDLKKCLNRKQ